MLTAGHCRHGNNRWWHHHASNGVEYGFMPDTLQEDEDGNDTNIWKEDHGFIVDDTVNSTGVSIEQTMQVDASTGFVSLRSVRSRNVTDESNSGRWMCRDAASPLHSDIPGITSNYYRTFCGAILGRHPEGSIRYAAPVCVIDSGGAVHDNNGRAYGLQSTGTGRFTGTDCFAESQYVRIDTALIREGATIVTTTAPNPVMFRSNEASHRCISAHSSGVAHYTRYIYWNCLTDHFAQDFHAEPVTPLSGYNTDHYRLVRKTGNTDYCLSIDGTTGIGGNGTGNYALIHSWTCLGSASSPNPAQVWKFRFDDASPQSYLQLRPASATSKCLSVAGSNPPNGAALHLWTCSNGHPAKAWRVR